MRGLDPRIQHRKTSKTAYYVDGRNQYGHDWEPQESDY
jgi:hypothetical protein